MFALLAKIIGFFFFFFEAAAPKGPAGYIEIQGIFFSKSFDISIGRRSK